MRKYLLTLIALLGVVGCTPKPYAVNPEPDERGALETVPESEREGYMRIIGDWRWDQLQEAKDWAEIFPSCSYKYPLEANKWTEKYLTYLAELVEHNKSKESLEAVESYHRCIGCIDDYKEKYERNMKSTNLEIAKFTETSARIRNDIYIGSLDAGRLLSATFSRNFWYGGWSGMGSRFGPLGPGSGGTGYRHWHNGDYYSERHSGLSWRKMNLEFVQKAFKEFYEAKSIRVVPISGESDCKFSLGGIELVLSYVDFHDEPNKAKINKTRLSLVSLEIMSPDQNRAFWAAIKDKYSESYDSSHGEKWCSDYSCFSRYNEYVNITFTPYVTSILDAVKVDSSYF